MTEKLQQSIRKAADWGFVGGDLAQHFEHSQAFAAVLQARGCDHGSGVDLGSGGGLPSLVLLQELPNTELLLIEVMEKRAAFLREAIVDLGFVSRCQVVQRRAEEVGRDPVYRQAYDFVVARSFALPAITAEVAAGLLRLGGLLVVSEPPGSQGDRWHSDGLERVGLQLEDIERRTFGFAIIRKVALTSPQFPRVAGKAWKQPLF